MFVIDISWPLSPVVTSYKDKNKVEFTDNKTWNADGVRETTLTLNAHSGTHVDAPAHFLREGKTIDQVTLDRLMGDALVLDMTNCSEKITRDCLLAHDAVIMEESIILLRTINSDASPTDPFNFRFIYLEESGARYLAEKKVKAVGIDYLGIENHQPGHPTHLALMNGDVVIIEGLRLGHVPQGSYFFVCLPLSCMGIEAAPARAVLYTKE